MKTLMIIFLVIVVIVLLRSLIGTKSELMDTQSTLRNTRSSLEQTQREFKAHKYHHRFKFLPTKSLLGWLEDKNDEDDPVMIEEIEKIVSRRNRRKKS